MGFARVYFGPVVWCSLRARSGAKKGAHEEVLMGFYFWFRRPSVPLEGHLLARTRPLATILSLHPPLYLYILTTPLTPSLSLCVQTSPLSPPLSLFVLHLSHPLSVRTTPLSSSLCWYYTSLILSLFVLHLSHPLSVRTTPLSGRAG